MAKISGLHRTRTVKMKLTIYKELLAGAYRYSFWSAEEQRYVPLSLEQTRMLRAMGAQIVSIC